MSDKLLRFSCDLLTPKAGKDRSQKACPCCSPLIGLIKCFGNVCGKVLLEEHARILPGISREAHCPGSGKTLGENKATLRESEDLRGTKELENRRRRVSGDSLETKSIVLMFLCQFGYLIHLERKF